MSPVFLPPEERNRTVIPSQRTIQRSMSPVFLPPEERNRAVIPSQRPIQGASESMSNVIQHPDKVNVHHEEMISSFNNQFKKFEAKWKKKIEAGEKSPNWWNRREMFFAGIVQQIEDVKNNEIYAVEKKNNLHVRLFLHVLINFI